MKYQFNKIFSQILKGYKTGLNVSYKDATSIYIDQGSLHINDDTVDNYYIVENQITKTLTDLTASSWYAIYVKPSTIGLILSDNEIEYSVDLPVKDSLNGGYYHETNIT